MKKYSSVFFCILSILSLFSCTKETISDKKIIKAKTEIGKETVVKYAAKDYDFVVNLMKLNPKGFDLKLIPPFGQQLISSPNAELNTTNSYSSEDVTESCEYFNNLSLGFGDAVFEWGELVNIFEYEYYFTNPNEFDQWQNAGTAAYGGYGNQVMYHSKIIRQGDFQGRNISTLIEIPVKYIKIPIGGGQFKFKFFESQTPPFFSIIGSGMGEISEKTAQNYWYSDVNAGHVDASATETRTRILSVTGEIKFSANLNLEIFSAGVDLGGNFIVQSSEHAITRFVLIGDYTPTQIVGMHTMWQGTIFTEARYRAGDWKN